MGLADGEQPFLWQQRLLRELVSGKNPTALDIPTGLGKTSVMAIWLVARALGADVPRRLIYVVDRRAVVDQATIVAEQLRRVVDELSELKAALGLHKKSLAISTLRGQHADNREWLEDPSMPAIVVGTVDMIGSRLLFEGYGVSRKMRPYHAALIGADAWIVIDEAHLVPPFEKLVAAVVNGDEFRGRGEHAHVVPPLKLLSLSATQRATVGTATVFALSDEESTRDAVVAKRLNAVKKLTITEIDSGNTLAETLARLAFERMSSVTSPTRVLIFSDMRKVAVAAKAEFDKLQRAAAKSAGTPKLRAIESELLVGARRVYERTAGQLRLATLGFIAGSKPTQSSVLFATSAGEVGIDLDADHMICDVVAWERMVQRLGRVNRRGDGCAEITVLVEPFATDPKIDELRRKAKTDLSRKDVAAIAKADDARALHFVLQDAVKLLRRHEDGSYDASPASIRDLKSRAEGSGGAALKKVLDLATTESPLYPAVSRALVDAWSMTSLKEHTGRPAIAPWVRGWIADPPQSAVCWRSCLPTHDFECLSRPQVDAFFEAAPPQLIELLDAETGEVSDWLIARAKKALSAKAIVEREPCAFVLESDGTLKGTWSAAQLHDVELKALRAKLEDTTIVVDARLGGLSGGLLDKSADTAASTVDDDNDMAGMVNFRCKKGGSDETVLDATWRTRWRTELSTPEDSERKWLWVFKKRADAATEDDRSVSRLQTLVDHQRCARDEAHAIATRLGLSSGLLDAVVYATELHDEGKRADLWQTAFGSDKKDIYAKTPGPVNTRLLAGYRHEFGSLPYAEKSETFRSLTDKLRALGLHLIAAHHGFARPTISTEGCELPPSALEQRAADVALRFVRLQREWGPWGLSWLEALLRAADQIASRNNDESAESEGAK
jgi:CRISPR-associated endonuclease/helicase Cas3